MVDASRQSLSLFAGRMPVGGACAVSGSAALHQRSQSCEQTMNAQLHGKTALVTGGTSGIGLAIAHALLAEGVDVAVASRNPDADAMAQLNQSGGRVIAITADVSCEEDVVRMVDTVIRDFGRLDLYVNNAAQSRHQPITKIDSQSYRAILDTNLSACLWACREVARHMVSLGSGAILVVGSTSMYTPAPTETVYRITKYGLKSIVQSLAVELAPHKIRVNLLVPGHFRTRLTVNIPEAIEKQLQQNIPLRRLGNTSDCGSGAVFLLSNALSGYTTGAELVVDGGLSLRPLYFGTDEELIQLNSPV
jgi:NAD(P)-dependent dehydrogenase (short-subunit alcohol dehydrogenase family)